jgi:glutamine synthetase
MTPDQVRTAADARKIVEERKLEHVKVGVFDNDGVMRGKYMGRNKFFAALDKGFGFCDVVLGWDSNDQLYDNVKYTGWHTAYPDAPVRVLPETCRPVPFEGDMVMFLGEFAEKAEAVCPRGVLRRVLKKADDLGYSAIAATEFEFFMFKETPESVREKGFRNLTTMTPGYFGYSVLRSTVHSEFYHQLMNLCTEMRIPL